MSLEASVVPEDIPAFLAFKMVGFQNHRPTDTLLGESSRDIYICIRSPLSRHQIESTQHVVKQRLKSTNQAQKCTYLCAPSDYPFKSTDGLSQ